MDDFSRFAALADFGGDEGDCVEWLAYRNQPGYGRFRSGGRLVQAHRWSYEFFVGAIQAGMDLDHLCRNRGCVNPWHLEPVTRAENNRRKLLLVTRCPQGHAYSGDNLRIRDGNHRRCAECDRANVRRSRAKLRTGDSN